MKFKLTPEELRVLDGTRRDALRCGKTASAFDYRRAKVARMMTPERRKAFLEACPSLWDELYGPAEGEA